jgi:hypothetical protein
MGARIGALFGVVLIVVSIIVGLFGGLVAGAGLLCVLAYFLFVLVVLTMLFTRTPKDAPLMLSLRPDDRMVLKMFNLFIITPGAATLYAGLINILRMALIVWGAICLWKGAYWWGGFSLGYFAITSFHVPRLDPFAYLGPRAAEGHPFSIERLEAIERIRERRELINR